MTNPENFDDGDTQVAPPREFNPLDHQLELCKDGCFCMTYTIDGKCGKCGANKETTQSSQEVSK